ncbi:MAG TPA: dihydroorotase [Atribacteraceae bacterium]|nr:dihydroorotase [Atribacteraceae bacterium]
MTDRLLIQNGTLVQPSSGTLREADVLIKGGVIARIDRGIFDPSAQCIDAAGLLVGPGFINLHVHFRDLEEAHKENLLSGSRAAVKGGFTSVVCMPNTRPPLDTPVMIRSLLERNRAIGLINLYPTAAVTTGLNGLTMTEYGLLKEAGAVALSDDGCCVLDAALLSRAFQYASYFGLPFILHEEDTLLAGEGQVHPGETAFVKGLRGIPLTAEESILARDLVLCLRSGARVHFTHLSTDLSVDLIRWFRGKKARISADVTPHHLLLHEEDVGTLGNLAKVKPPLRRLSDIEALKEGIHDGTIEYLASDHAPHALADKEGDFSRAAFGISNLDVAVPLYVKALVDEGVVDWIQLWRLMSANPAAFLGLRKKGALEEGMDADLTVVDPDTEWEVKVDRFESKGRNCPFDGWPLRGWPVYTVIGGRLMMSKRSLPDQ